MQSDTVHLENAEMEQSFQNTMRDDDEYLKLFWWGQESLSLYVTNVKEEVNLLREVNDAKEGCCGLPRCRKL